MFGNRKYKIRDSKAINESLRIRVNKIYSYRHKEQIAELTRINRRRNELFSIVARQECTSSQRLEYDELNIRKQELNLFLSKAKAEIEKQVFSKN